MASVAMLAELTFRNGQSHSVSVSVENKLRSLINGINELTENVSQLLSELVQQEKAHGACAVGEEEDSDEDDEGPHNSELKPPSKRART